MIDISGKTIKGFDFHKRLGGGGFGDVYQAFQSTVSREVAIKVIHPRIANQPEFIRRFETEAQLIARLEHLHIVPLYDYWREPDSAYLVMRLMRGGSLSQSIQQSGARDLDSAALVLDQITAALDRAHQNGIIHRDIKPPNILLDEDDNAYLGDFGIAKDMGEQKKNLTQPDALIGSLDYLAPEQARSEPVTPQTDIYSLGVVLYEMLAGEHPFPGLTPVERMFKHLNDPLPVLHNLDSERADAINEIIQKATAKNPAHRYASALEVARAFREAAAIGHTAIEENIVAQFTWREQEILQLLASGKTNSEIAQELVVAITTVRWYLKQIYKKLGVRSRVQAIVRAQALNLLVQDTADTGLADTSGERVSVALPEPENPYKGLRAFQAADARDFFGRETITKKLVSSLGEESPNARFLAVVGPSGSGKSSLVKAGLIPALWRGELPGSEHWFIVDMLPGSHPLDELEIALTRIAANKNANLNEQLQRDARGLLRAASLILPEESSELVIVIDQFEEVFTLVEDETRRTHFLNLIHTAATNPRSRVRVIITLRADFYDRPLHYPGIAELIQARTETVLPLTADELERAIVHPAAGAGIRFEEGLPATIVGEVHYQPGALPLLQYALTELFEGREGRLLTHAAYQAIGGTIGALAKRAEEIFQGLDSEGQEAARQMFLRLVMLGEGVEDTRRRTARHELLAITSDPDRMEEIIDTFAAYRLLSLDHDPATRAPTVEVAHEAILREWGRLREWLNEHRTDIRLQRTLARAASEWQGASQDPSFLLRGARLEQFASWRTTTEMALTPAEQSYLQASLDERDRLHREEESRQARETRLEQRAQRVLQYLVGVFLAAALVSGGLALWANDQRVRAVAAEQEALRQASIGLAALAEKELGGVDRERSVLLALEAVENYPFTPQAAGALAHSVEEFRSFRVLDASQSVSDLMMMSTWSPDGTRIAATASASPNSVVIWDAATGVELLSVNSHGDLCQESFNLMHDLTWSPAGDRLAVTAQDPDSQASCGAVILDANSGERLLVLAEFEAAARSLGWSPNGLVLLTGHEDGTIQLWDSHFGTHMLSLSGHAGIVRDATFSPNGSQVASASEDGTIRIWETKTGGVVKALAGHAGPVRSVTWSPDGSRIVSGGNDGLPRVWDIASGETLFVLPGHIDAVAAVTWSADGRRIATQGLDAVIKVWDAITGGFLFQITNAAPDPATKRGFVEFSPDGKWILAGGSRVLRLLIWDASLSAPKLFGHTFGQEWGAWSPDGTLIATSGEDGSARLWDAQTGQQVGAFDQGSFWGDWAPDGSRLAFAEGIGAHTVSLWDAKTGAFLGSLSAPDDEHGSHQLLTMDWSPDASLLAAADFRPGTPQAIYIWNTKTHELVSQFQTDDTCHLGWPRWSRDGTKIATGCIFVQAGINTPVRIWDVATGKEIMKLNSEHGWTYRAVWSPDGTQLLATYEHGVARIWDVKTGMPLLTFAGHQGAVDGNWSPDGTLIASTGFANGSVKIWDSKTGEEFLNFSVPGAPLTIEWSPDGTHVIITGDGFNEPIIKRVWQSTEELVQHAYDCCVTRELTSEERSQFGLPPTASLDN